MSIMSQFPRMESASMLMMALLCTTAQAGAPGQPSQPSNSSTIEVSSAAATAEDYFGLKLKVGQKFGNVFSKIVSYEGGGVDEHVGRIGGSALYEVTEASPDRPRFLVHAGMTESAAIAVWQKYAIRA